MSQLEEFKDDMSELEDVIDTSIITDDDTEYVQVIWPHNPGENAVEIHNVHKHYDNITQVSPSETLRENNPDDESKYTQYFTLAN